MMSGVQATRCKRTSPTLAALDPEMGAEAPGIGFRD
jgi:hypothetical protein